MAKICVCGMGYIGLPIAALLVSKGHEVVGYDISEAVRTRIDNGDAGMHEPGLQELVKECVASGKLVVRAAPEKSDVFIISVPTPVTHEKRVDLSHVESVAKTICPHLSKGNLVILESTVPPGTTKELLLPILEHSGLSVKKGDLRLAHCPERVLPGHILKELTENDRIIGGVNAESIKETKRIYGSFVKGEMHCCDATTAEFVKLIENTYRDVNIALANELALMAHELGIDGRKAITLANKHPRVNIHQPGPGVGGHCIPVDPYFLIERSPDMAKLIALAREINEDMPERILSIVKEKLAGLKQPTVALYGVAYKPDVDDARESPSTRAIENMKTLGYQVKIHDPYVESYKYPLVDATEAANEADLLLFLTGHSPYKKINPATLHPRRKIVIDAVAVLDEEAWRSAGYDVWKL